MYCVYREIFIYVNMIWWMFVISSADAPTWRQSPANIRDPQHHLEKWVWKSRVPRQETWLRTLTSNNSKRWEPSKILSHCKKKHTCTCFAIIRSNNNHLFQLILRLYVPIHKKRLYRFQDHNLNQVLHIALKWDLSLINVMITRELGVNGVHRRAGKMKEAKVKCRFFFDGFMPLTVNDACKCSDIEAWCLIFLVSELCVSVSESERNLKQTVSSFLYYHHLLRKQLIHGHQPLNRRTVISVVWLTNSVLLHFLRTRKYISHLDQVSGPSVFGCWSPLLCILQSCCKVIHLHFEMLVRGEI